MNQQQARTMNMKKYKYGKKIDQFDCRECLIDERINFQQVWNLS